MSKRKVLSLEDKGNIIGDIERGSSQADVCRKYDLSKSTVCNIIKNKEKIFSALNSNKAGTKKIRLADRDDVDQALLKWFTTNRSSVPISGHVLKTKAEQLAVLLDKEQFVCSEGWLDRWKKRHNITAGKISGEARSVDRATTSDWITSKWLKVCADYSPNDIFNGDEAGLFYQLTPDKTHKFKNEKCIGGKLSKNRITLWICANMSGTEKRELLVIGKFKKPRCFKNVKKLPVRYQSSKKAWMTSSIFQEELHCWDRELRLKGRKILLLVDNCPAHPEVENLSNIQLVFLPANATSVLQPMDQGVIRSFKSHYRKEVTLHIIKSLEAKNQKPIDILQALRFANKAWKSVTVITIQNCFRHAGLATDNVAFNEEDNLPLKTLMQVINANTDENDVNDFIDVDADLVTYEIPSDEEIVAAINNVSQEEEEENEGEEEEDVNYETVPTVKEALESVRTVIRFLESVSNVDSSVKKAEELEKELENIFIRTVCKKQQEITDYFKNN